MGRRIEGWARELLERPRVFGTLAAQRADGWPRQVVVWFELQGDDILVNSAVGRRWPSELLREPRCSLIVEQGYEWVGVRAVAEALRDPAAAQADIARLARRYHADDPETAERLIREVFQQQRRISFLLHPLVITEHHA